MMLRLVAILLALALASGALPATGATPLTSPASASALATLDAALATATADAQAAVRVLQVDLSDPAARLKLAAAAADAVAALEAAGEIPECVLWWRTAWVAWTLLARSVEALEAADAARKVNDLILADVAMTEFGFDALGYNLVNAMTPDGTVLRSLRQPPCPPAPKPSPIPAPSRMPTPKGTP